jgi:L-amino acid N-acyltransferase YncA/DNA-binding MarR family transcriptional regulator
MQDAGRRMYAALDEPLEPNWYALILYLERGGPATVGEAAQALRVSHPAIVDLARRMDAAGLLVATSDPRDGRRRVLELSPRCRRLLPRFKRLWSVIGSELDDLMATTAGGDALASLAALEAALDGSELDVRITRRLERLARSPEETGSPARQVATIRAIRPADRPGVMHIASELVRSADTYAYAADIAGDDLWAYWSPQAPGSGFVAVVDSAVAGMFVIRPNQPGPGAHVANASYAVRADMRGMGLGRQMGEASLDLAAGQGYEAMQFNAVVGTNAAAIRLWRSLGFAVVGTIPAAFRLPDGDLVPLHVMHRTLP